MKNYLSILSFIVLFFISSCKDDSLMSSNEQDLITRTGTGQMIVATSLETKMVDNIAHTDYEINDLIAGSYYLSGWIEFPLINGELPEYKVKINGLISDYTFKPTQPGFQNIILTDYDNEPALLNLIGGGNTVTLVSVGREILNIEKLKVAANLKDAVSEESDYRKIIDAAKNGNSFAPALLVAGIVPPTKSDEIYDYALNVPASYIYGQSIYMEQQRVKITTSGATVPHVIQLTSDDGRAYVAYGTTSATLDVMLPDWWGNYRLSIKAMNPGESGVLNFNYWENCQGFIESRDYIDIPIRGTVIPVKRSLSSNYFLAKSVIGSMGNSMSLHEEYPGKSVAGSGMCRVYPNPSDMFTYYTHDAYVNYGGKVSNLVVGTASLMYPNTIVDVYMGLNFASNDIYSVFPNLQKNNTFRSGPPTGIYNCISWSVERTDYWEWPGNRGSSYYNTNLLTAFDKLYSVYGYTRTGANESNAGIALWATSSSVASITHASVTKNINTRKPHGFDWESKCGAMERVMHERDGLNGSSYGSIRYYYKPNGVRSLAQTAMKPESIDITPVKSLNSFLKSSIPAVRVLEFENKYAAWKKTWANPKLSIHSDPRKYAESTEYLELLKLCREYGKGSWPLFIEKLAEGDILSINLVEDLTFTENLNLLEKVKSNAIKTRSSGSVMPSMYSNYINYCHELLNVNNDKIQRAILTVK